jgi:hypothetical protein
MAISSLYKGFVSGKSTPIALGPNNPAMDTSLTEQDARNKLAAHVSKGVKKLPKIDGPSKRVRNSGVAGSKVSGGGRTRGGAM